VLREHEVSRAVQRLVGEGLSGNNNDNNNSNLDFDFDVGIDFHSHLDQCVVFVTHSSHCLAVGQKEREMF